MAVLGIQCARLVFRHHLKAFNRLHARMGMKLRKHCSLEGKNEHRALQ